MHHHPATAARADRRDEEDDEAAKESKRDKKEPGGLDDAVFTDCDRVGLMDRAEHGHHVAADRDILAEANAAEKADQVVPD